MTIEYVTFVAQLLILFAVSHNAASAWRSNRFTKQTTDLIGQYRRELEWLTARIEALEGKTNGVKQRT